MVPLPRQLLALPELAPRRLACLLLLGALLNILLTLAIAYFDHGSGWQMKGVEVEFRDRNPLAGEGDGTIELYWDKSRPGATAYWAFVRPNRAPEPGVPPRSPTYVFSHPITGWIQSKVLPWERGIEPWPTTLREFRLVRLVGWPFRSLWHLESKTDTQPRWTIMGPEPYPTVVGGVEVFQGKTNGNWDALHILPYRPTWTGLILNPIFYAAAMAVLSLTPRWFRSLRQRLLSKPGHCPACGYDRAGLPPHSPCPECGRS